MSPRAADLVAARLYEAGCRHAFGMPGGEVLTLLDALERVGIAFTLCKHETAAGFMAEGVYHVTGAPGILVATVGPGLMNGVNVIANAEQDRVPLIVLTGCIDADEAQTYTHQVLDHRAVLEPITKATYTLTAQSADIIADRAVTTALAPRAGPVLIDVPIAVADQRVDVPRRRRAPAAPVVPADLSQAQDWLTQSARPLMIVGLDVLRDGGAERVRQVVEAQQIPLITTYKAKGVVPEDHPLALGGAGLSPLADRQLLSVVDEADLILCVGYDPIEMRTGWREPWDPTTKRVIDIAAVDNDHYMHQASLSFVADPGATLEALTRSVPPKDRPDWAARVAACKSALAEAFPTDDPWGPAAIIAETRSAMPPETLLTVDSGAHRILISQMWTAHAPHSMLQSTGLCTMGCAVPLAIGAKLADPTRPVLSVSGDAGMLMVAGELATAAELGLAPIFLVFVDSSLALIELKQRQRQMQNAGVDFGTHDFAAIGRAFGGNGVTVHDRATLRAALQDALAADRFTLIAAVIDRKGYDGRI